MKRSREERIALTEKKVAHRLRQLIDAGSLLRKVDGEPWVRLSWLKDRSILGRCGHRRCSCHASQRMEWNDRWFKDVDAVDYPLPEPDLEGTIREERNWNEIAA